jgi:hypothetical protein
LPSLNEREEEKSQGTVPHGAAKPSVLNDITEFSKRLYWSGSRVA